VEAGAGEIIVQSVDRDGTFLGYDEPLLASIARSVAVPVIALGGARNLEDFYTAVAVAACSAAAAGSMFVFQGAVRGILISYPSETELDGLYARIAA
jgi:cyclase